MITTTTTNSNDDNSDDSNTPLPPSKLEVNLNNDELITAFVDALEELQKSGGVFNPRKFFSKLVAVHPQFGGGDQNDSHELLRHLLDSVM